ncbi:hypothetical protein [Salegentibacter chungangensis]|uniref:Uncharacterized protein n=1 Tax=Salegentibacter chungangensis TaxID=1335724 RepID=A0ABW3NNR9_9FLAO
MSEFYDYFTLSLTLSPLFFFIIAVSFRLLDNSALLFLQKEILVNSSNVSVSCIRHQIQNHPDKSFKKQLKKALLFRHLQRTFLCLMLFTLPVMIYNLASL